MHVFVRIFITAHPVIVFLILLIFLESYKLVRLRFILLTVFLGSIIALLCLGINRELLELLGMSISDYSRYIAPVIEESLKAGFIAYLIKARKVGFLVDTAIYSFALGAGFAINENIYYLWSLPNSNLFLWLVRGFGPAVMHGGATSLFGIISKGLSERGGSERVRVFLPGLGIAIVIHSLFNHFVVFPVLSTVGLTIAMPLLMIIVFQESEKATRNWLGVGFDTDAELLEMVTTGNISQTRLGKYLLSLKSSFPGEVVADMLCLLRIHLELSIRAKGILLIREAGFATPRDPTIREKFEELRYLERSIGRTGRLAIMPFLRWSSRELWQLNVLNKK